MYQLNVSNDSFAGLSPWNAIDLSTVSVETGAISRVLEEVLRYVNFLTVIGEILKITDQSASYVISRRCLKKLFSESVMRTVSQRLPPEQHGFMSTLTNLVQFAQHACDVVDGGGQLDVVYTDFTKAFDQLDHGLLLCKLSLLGFSDGMLKC